jgi:DNA polymerase-3 subunit gamma/tau
MTERSVAFAGALDELASLFHRIAVAQSVPAAAAAYEDSERIAAVAAALGQEAVQLAYQICVQGRFDLALAPDEATGFAMTLLRLLAFEPAGRTAEAAPTTPAASSEPKRPVRREAPLPAGGQGRSAASGATPPNDVVAATAGAVLPNDTVAATASAVPETAVPTSLASVALTATAVALPLDGSGWAAFVAALAMPPMAAQLAAQTELKAISGNVLTLALPAVHKHLADKVYADKLKAALERATGRRLMLAFEVGSSADDSLAARKGRELAEQKAKTEAAFRDEPFVRDLVARFDARIRPDSIKPLP